MYGTPPPARSEGAVVTLRVLFVLCGILSCGMLSAVPLFRTAILRGRWYDWTLAIASLPLVVTALAVVGSVPETDPRTDVAMWILILNGVGASVYFLVADIRHYRLSARRHPYPPYAVHPQPHPYPQPQPPYTQGPTRPVPPHQGPQNPHQVPQQNPQQGPAYGYPSQQSGPARTDRPPYTGPRPATPAAGGHRIDQVRAELDELSDLLRNDGDGRDSGGTPPRDPRTGRGDAPR